MIFFTNKDGNLYSIDKPVQFLSGKALERRLNQNIRITTDDLPVSEQYLDVLRKHSGLQVYFSTKWLNGVLVEMDEAELVNIESLEFVSNVKLVAYGSRMNNPSHGGRRRSVKENDIMSYNGSETKEQNEFIGVDEMHDSGFHGEKMLIAVFDSGFEYVDNSSFFSHIFEEQRLLSSRDFIRRSHNVFQYDTHGSKVLSCIFGYKEGVYSGTAPRADLVLCVTEDIKSEYSIEEYNWLFAAEFADSLGVDIINSSVGYSYFDDDAMDYTYDDFDGNTTVVSRAAAMAASKGMLVVCSNGNEGNNSWTYLNAPADADSVLSVGATDYDLEKANFSSYGPTSDDRIKPDLSALGSWVKVALREEISHANGTSFSAPMVAGLAAGLWQAFPHLTSQEVIQYLKMTAHQADAPDTLLGYGIPNFRRAFNRIKVTEGEVTNQFVLFPNPVAEKRMISFYVDSFLGNEKAELRFFDLKGSLLKTEEVTVNNTLDPIELDVSFLKPGSYIINFENGALKKKLKLVVL